MFEGKRGLWIIDKELNMKMNDFNKSLFRVLERTRMSIWHRTFERAERLRWLYRRVVLVVTSRLQKESCILGLVFARRVVRIGKGSGLLYLAKMLKQVDSSLKIAYAGGYTPGLLPVPIGLNRSGYPTIIPAYHRKIIMQRNSRADCLVKLYLSWCSVYKLIPLVSKPKWNNLKSIASPAINRNWVAQLIEGPILERLIRYMIPWVVKIPWIPTFSFEPTWKSIAARSNNFRKVCQVPFDYPKDILHNCLVDISQTIDGIESLCFISDTAKFGDYYLWKVFADGDHILYPLDSTSSDTFVYSEVKSPGFLYTLLLSINSIVPGMKGGLQKYPFVGRLGSTAQGGGKLRIFAILPYLAQRLFSSFHEWCMTVLSRIPMDGTFDQERPLRRLFDRWEKRSKRSSLYSFDLKSATDRWPAMLMRGLISGLFNAPVATGLMNCLDGAKFLVSKPIVPSKLSLTKFTTGTPLGLVGMWPLFALSHHLMVGWASLRAEPNRVIPFQDYAILGDDIVIASSRVAKEYQAILAELGVEISYSKSLISKSLGGLEFAKRYFLSWGKRDLSPVSALLLSTPGSLSLLSSLRYSRGFESLKPSVFVGLAGGGFRVSGSFNLKRPSYSLSVKWERLRTILNFPKFDVGDILLQLWLGRGSILDPSVKFMIWKEILDHNRPRDIFSMDCSFTIAEQFVLEKTIYKGWLSRYNRHLLWFFKLMEPGLCYNLWDALDAPMVKTTLSTEDTTRRDYRKMSFLWRLWDRVAKFKPLLCLEPGPIGWSGEPFDSHADFLLTAQGWYYNVPWSLRDPFRLRVKANKSI